MTFKHVDSISRRLRQAASKGEVGTVIRLARTSLGLTQAELGSACGMSQSAISRIEHHGPAANSVRYLRIIATALDLPPHLLGLAPNTREALAPTPNLDQLPTATATRPLGSDLRDSRHLYVDPNFIIQDVRLQAVADLTNDRLHSGTGDKPSLLTGSSLLAPIDAWTSHAVRPFVRPDDQRLGDDEIQQIEMTVQAFQSWDKRFRLGIRRKAIVGQLDEVAGLVTNATNASIRQRLIRAVGELSRIAGSMAWDSGLEIEAQRYYILALRAAHAGSHPLLGIQVLGNLARQSLYLNMPSDALEIARAAQRQAAEYDIRAVPMLKLREGWAYAQMGRPDALRRAVSDAEEAFAKRSSSDCAPGFITRFDEAELLGTAGGRYLEVAQVTGTISHAQTAISYIEQALVDRSASRRRNKVLDTINLARARLMTDEPEEAAHLTLEVLALARPLASPHLDRKLRRFAEEMRSYAPVACLAEARDVLVDYLGPQSTRGHFTS